MARRPRSDRQQLRFPFADEAKIRAQTPLPGKPPTIKSIKDAIEARTTAIINTTCGRRTVHIYRLWRRADGQRLVEFYQSGGCSDWLDPVGWKIMRLTDIRIETTMRRKFPIQPDFNIKHTRPPGELEAQIDLPKSRRREFPGQRVFPELLPPAP